ncbi:hypothetical protein [Aquipuribacter sp. SD81]|uniref:hypothetical protein n=1 Tax=Aquipuribacter sp. SD81 TaxID=3127703 RepID=UPI0030173F02
MADGPDGAGARRGRAAVRSGLRGALGRLGLARAHPLGEGLWRGDFDRVDRASRRVLQVLNGPGGEQVDALVADLTACRELVWRCCVEAHHRAPGADREVPAEDDLAAAHRALSRAATAVAQCAQALVMADDVETPGGLDAARRALAAAAARADEAARALTLDA